MLDSIDCMHWKWKNCLVAWQGQYCRDDHRKLLIILKVVASQDLWILHTCFGVASSNNDINVLNQPLVFNDVLQGQVPSMKFTINRTYMNYYLVDDIYFDWATFVKTISMSPGEKRKLFAKCKESTRKNEEWAFDVLKYWFTIICGLSRSWHVDTMKNIILTCIILHNIIVEDEWDSNNDIVDANYDHRDDEI